MRLIGHINYLSRFHIKRLWITGALVFFTGLVSAQDAGAGGGSDQEVDPRQIYAVACALCHKSGLNGAPKYRDKPIWKKRIAKGRETLYKNSIEGIGAMPPKGGKSFLTDQQVKSAVDFMVEGSGGWGDTQ
jgi:cytochrome c5